MSVFLHEFVTNVDCVSKRWTQNKQSVSLRHSGGGSKWAPGINDCEKWNGFDEEAPTGPFISHCDVKGNKHLQSDHVT